MLKNNKEIKGIKMSNMKRDIKYSTCRRRHFGHKWCILFKLLQSKQSKIFCKQAGSKVNLSKTQCILLGSLKDKFTDVGCTNTTNDTVWCLSMHIGHNKNQFYELNWLHTIQNMKKLFESWIKRKLTFYFKSMCHKLYLN